MEPAVGQDSMSCESAAALDLALGRIVQALTPSQQDWDRRRTLVTEHVARLARQLNSPHPIQISTFGSSLSGLCITSSDLDLGLFGRMNGCPVEQLKSKQQRSLLAQVMRALNAASLAQGKQIQAIWGARVPLLKYTCSLSGLDCDLSIQGSGALLKANFMYILNSHCQQLAPLYRLVKLWAQAHDLNDASRGTLNSTSLLYLTIFYLQQVHLLPPLQKLVPRELLQQPQARLLQGGNQQVWDDPQRLTRLLTAVQGRMAAWVAGHQQQQLPGVGQLLLGFFQMWSGQLSDWVLGQNRDLHADLWHGTWTPGVFPKKYIFCLQDPFDASDCPARAVGSNTNTNGGTAAFIAYMFSSSSRVIQRYLDNCQSQSADGGRLSADGGGAAACWFDECGGSQCSAAAAGAVPPVRIQLCKVLAWLFGPQGLLLLGSFEQQQQQLMHGNVSWAAAPFPHRLIAAVQQRQQQSAKPASLLPWLVEQLGAQLSQDHNILTLQHIGLLMKQISATAKAALQSGNPSEGLHRQQQQDKQEAEEQHPQQQDVVSTDVAAGLEADGSRTRGVKQPEHTARGACAHQDNASAQQQQQQFVNKAVTSDHSNSSIPMQGPGLGQIDAVMSQEQQHLSHRVAELRACYKHLRPRARASPKRYPKAIKKTVQHSLTTVARRLLQLQQQEGADVAYGFLPVLEQHGFTGMLEDWGFLRDGVLWAQVLPESMVADNRSSSSQLPSLKVLLGFNGNACASLHRLYSCVRMANQQQLEAATAAGQDLNSPVLQQASAAVNLRTEPSYETTLSKGAKGPKQKHAVVHLPALVFLSSSTDGSLVLKQLIRRGTNYSQLLQKGSAADTDKRLAAKVIAKQALERLASNADIVLAVQDAMKSLQKQKRQQEGAEMAQVQGAAEQQQLDDRQQHQSNLRVTAGQQLRNAAQAAVGTSVTAAGEVLITTPSSGEQRGQVCSSSSSSSFCPSASVDVERQRQQRVGRQAEEDTTAPDGVLEAFTKLSVGQGVRHSDGQQGAKNGMALTAGTSKADAVRTAFRNLRTVREQIESLQQRITQKQDQLLQDEQTLEVLLQEQQQPMPTAARGSSERTIMGTSIAGTVEADGDLLLQLAMQQSMELARKNLKNNINNLKSRMKSNKQALQQFEQSMQELKQKEACSAVALQEAEAACPAGSKSQCRQQ